MKDLIKLIFGILFILFTFYLAISCAVFEFRNPKANRMFLFRNFSEVLTWQKLDTYQ